MFARRGYLLEVSDRMPNRRVAEELVDILAAHGYNELFLLGEGEIALPSPRFGAYCEMQGIELALLDRNRGDALLADGGTVAVASERARSLAGRVERMRERMAAAETAGRARRARRFLVTDFADGYAWAPPVVSLPAIVLGGNFAMSGAQAAKMDLERALNRVLGANVGGLLLRLGTLYLRGGAVHEDESELFRILAHDHGYSRHPGMTDHVLEDIGAVAEGVRILIERNAAENEWAAEIAYAAMLVEAAAHRRDERRLLALRAEHSRLWRLRAEDAGRAESLARLPRF